MAIDFLVLALLLVSFIINLLALAAFWITPGLRTTANRFTINLLIINLIGCVILAPTLFLSSAAVERNQLDALAEFNGRLSRSRSSSSSSSSDNDSIEFYSKPGNHQMIIRHNGQLVEEEGIIVRKNSTSTTSSSSSNDDLFETLYKCNSTYCRELTIDENRDTIVITEFEEEQQQDHSSIFPPKIPNRPKINMRCWSIDLAAALGALAVLLVVGDTWCAVTDPLRYHSRISGVKAWIFIALTWILGIFFGALSALRTIDFESEDSYMGKKRQRWTFTETYYSLYTSNGIFDMAFACIYFVVIILLPFGFVCGMYWRIFSEARENGLRMRQNGSSPLLQSALNLTQQQQQQQQQQVSQHFGNNYNHRHSISSASSSQGGGGGNGGGSSGGGLHLTLDQRKSSPASMRRDSAAKVLLPTISDDDGTSSYVDPNEHDDDEQLMSVPEHQQQQQQQHSSTYADRNQNNILLTLQSASGEIKRNYSARQLPILGISSQDLTESDRLKGIRQIHSSPNLQKYTEIRQDSSALIDDAHTTTTCSAHLLGYNQLQHTQLQIQHHQAAVARHHQPHSYHPQHRRHSHALQIPQNLQGSSPKSIGYMSTLRHRLSNASSLFKYREESRAARISILVVFMFLVSYLPYGFLVLLQSRLPAANFANSSELAIAMILLGNLTSPFIFAYRNKRVRRGVKRLFGMDAHSIQERSFHSQCGGGGGATNGGNGSTNGRNRSSPAIIKRNSSKVSTYSLNSCRFTITPQNSLQSNDGNVPGLHSPSLRSSLRPNSSCSTIINFMLTKHSNGNGNGNSTMLNDQQKDENDKPHQIILMPTTATTKTPPKSTTTTTATMKPIVAKPSRNLFKLLFKGSQNLSRSMKSCAQGARDAEAEPVQV